MARNPGDEDQAGFSNNEYIIGLDDSAILVAKTDSLNAVQPVLSASVGVTVLSASTAQATLTAKQHFVLADATTANFGITLPSAATVAGRTYTVKKIDAGANTVFLSAASGETIETATEVGLDSFGESVSVMSDGVQFHITAFYSGNLGV